MQFFIFSGSVLLQHIYLISFYVDLMYNSKNHDIFSYMIYKEECILIINNFDNISNKHVFTTTWLMFFVYKFSSIFYEFYIRICNTMKISNTINTNKK